MRKRIILVNRIKLNCDDSLKVMLKKKTQALRTKLIKRKILKAVLQVYYVRQINPKFLTIIFLRKEKQTL